MRALDDLDRALVARLADDARTPVSALAAALHVARGTVQARIARLLDDGVIRRQSNRAGGTEGGMSTGDVLRVRAAMKPISTVPRALRTVDVATGEAATAIHQRSDVCAVPAAGVVAEAMVALVLAEACLEKFGGDSVAETRRNHEAYLAGIPELLTSWE